MISEIQLLFYATFLAAAVVVIGRQRRTRSNTPAPVSLGRYADELMPIRSVHDGRRRRAILLAMRRLEETADLGHRSHARSMETRAVRIKRLPNIHPPDRGNPIHPGDQPADASAETPFNTHKFIANPRSSSPCILIAMSAPVWRIVATTLSRDTRWRPSPCGVSDAAAIASSSADQEARKVESPGLPAASHARSSRRAVPRLLIVSVRCRNRPR